SGFGARGLRPRTRACAGVRASIRPIHFGLSGSAPAAGRFRHSRLARSRKDAPSTIFSHETESDDVLLVDALLWSEMEYTTATRTLSATTYPSRKSGPFTPARLEN